MVDIVVETGIRIPMTAETLEMAATYSYGHMLPMSRSVLASAVYDRQIVQRAMRQAWCHHIWSLDAGRCAKCGSLL